MGVRTPTPSRRIARYRRGSVELVATDALAGLARLDHGSVSVVVTSPPYNTGQPYSLYRDRRPRSEYLAWIGEVGRAVRRVLSPQGSFFLNVGSPPRDPWLAFDVAREVGRSLHLQNVLHWVKSIALGGLPTDPPTGRAGIVAVGHYRPVASSRFVHSAHEYVFHFTPTGTVPLDRLAIGVPYQDASNLTRWRRAGTGLRCRGNVWFLPYATIQRRERDRPHPATFPEELPEWCFRLHGLERIRFAVDPFVGLGSSAIAAARLGLPFLGFDIDPEYLAEAARRLARLPRLPSAERRVRPAIRPRPN